MHILTQFLQDNSRRAEYFRLGFVLLLGLINGLIFTILVPPWQHYDEPLHFEYVWLISDRLALPNPGDSDLEMNRAAAESMLAHGFYRGMSIQPSFDSVDKPVWIGDAPQLSNPPFFYLLASAPSILFGIDDVTNQLIAARFVSLIMFLITILAGWGIVAELTPRGHVLRMLLPMGIALSPGFTDLMTSVNNDTAAVVLVSLVLWGSVRMVMGGFSWGLLVACLVAVVAGNFSKEVAILALPVFVIAVLFAVLRARWRWVPWVILSTVLVGILLVVISFDDAQYWYRSTSQIEPLRSEEVQPVNGKYVLAVNTNAESTPRWSSPLFQPLPALTGIDLQNRTFTIGAWIWADAPGEIRSPTFSDGQSYFFENVSVGIEPAFYSFSAHLGNSNGWRAWISLDPRVPQGSAINKVYYDGLVIVDGDVETQLPPVYHQVGDDQLEWEAKAYTNLVRNGSAEQPGIRLAAFVDNISANYLPSRPSLMLMSLTDFQGASWMYKASGQRLLRTFIGKFGWGNVPLLGSKPYLMFTTLILIGVLAGVLWVLINLFHKHWELPWEAFAILALLLVLAWGGALTRGVVHMGVVRLYFPTARYAAVAIIPTLMVIIWGWLCLSDSLSRVLTRRNLNQIQIYIPIRFVVYFVAFVLFDIYGLLSIYQYFYGG